MFVASVSGFALFIFIVKMIYMIISPDLPPDAAFHKRP